MASDNARGQLFDLLDREAFRPVLDARPDDYDRDRRDKLRDVQAATRRERKRFEDRDSASGIIDEYRNDLHSGAAEEVHRELRALDLPTINDVEDRFASKARELGLDY